MSETEEYRSFVRPAGHDASPMPDETSPPQHPVVKRLKRAGFIAAYASLAAISVAITEAPAASPDTGAQLQPAPEPSVAPADIFKLPQN